MDPLALFSPHGVAQTLHVAVLIGVLVLLGFTETLGWVFSGLVVPGYLASVLVVEPAAALTVVAEALVTFVVARTLSDVVSRSGSWSRFFGRERFFLLIVVSVLVRQTSEVWLIPSALRWLDGELGTGYHLARSAASIGLVLVPLTANMFWKLDVRRGLIQVAVPTLLTYVVLRGLLAGTNLSFSRLELTYEDVALDFLASPKAYILLCTGAYVASQTNLFYGWDFSGILVPALLGLAVFSPLRLVTSAAETVVLVVGVRALTSLPWLRTRNLEGPRKVALVFTLSVVLKYALGFLPDAWLHGLKVTDLFGFGYLVPSLMAVKILQKQTYGRVLGPAFAVALIGFAAGSALGFALDRVAPPPPEPLAHVDGDAAPTRLLLTSPMGVMGLGHARARLDPAGEVAMVRPWRERQRYHALWRAVDGWLASPGGDGRARVEAAADAVGMALIALPARPGGSGRPAWSLIEREERLGRQIGWDTAVLFPGAAGPVLEIPRPWSEAPTAEAAAVVCAAVACRAMIASGVDTHELRLPDGDATVADDAPLMIAHRALRAAPAIRLRADASHARGTATLHVAGAVPAVDLRALAPAALELSWTAPLDPDRALDRGGRVAVLVAHPDDWWRLIARGVAAHPVPEPALRLDAWLSARGDAAPAPPLSETELRFLEHVLMGALVAAPPALATTQRLAIGSALAASLDHELHLLLDGGGPGDAVWVLSGPPGVDRGVTAGRLARGAPIAVEAPRPGVEAGTLHLAIELWSQIGAELLAIAPAMPGEEARAGLRRDHRDGDGGDDDDGDAPGDAASSFDVVHQAVHGALSGHRDPVILEIRGVSSTRALPDGAALIVATGRPLLDEHHLSPRLAGVLGGPLAFALPRLRFHDGAAALVDLVASGGLAYSTRVGGVAHAALWFAETGRDPYRERDRDRAAAEVLALGLAMVDAPLVDALVEPTLTPATAEAALDARVDALTALAGRYAATGNPQALRRLVQRAGGAVTAGYDPDRRRPYLRIELRSGRRVARAVVLLGGSASAVRLAPASDARARVERALLARPRALSMSGEVAP